jgi:hypothetical protein
LPIPSICLILSTACPALHVALSLTYPRLGNSEPSTSNNEPHAVMEKGRNDVRRGGVKSGVGRGCNEGKGNGRGTTSTDKAEMDDAEDGRERGENGNGSAQVKHSALVLTGTAIANPTSMERTTDSSYELDFILNTQAPPNLPSILMQHSQLLPPHVPLPAPRCPKM